MHESSLMTGLMRQIERVAIAQGNGRVVAVSLWLGALTQMSGEHLAQHFVHAAAGTVAQGARLDVTVSDDPLHSNAQHVLLEGIEVEDAGA
jgi:hydrogenase nickel incorporation protein HypA/HybF